VGDIVVDDGDIFGDGVNVAARLEGWLIQAASAFRRAFKRTRQAASTSLSKTWASKRSRILRGPSGHIEWSGLPARH
jgi:class 3 adenylate cyclase